MRSSGAQGPSFRLRSNVCITFGLAAVAAISLFASRDGRAQVSSRDDVEAAYLYNFGKFVRWPAGGDQGTLLVCVDDQETFSQAVAKLVAGEEIGGRPVSEREVAGPGEIGGCSILFIGSGDRERRESFLAAAEGKPVLTVGNGPDFLAQGGMIQFVQVGDHVRFSVNLEAVNRHRMALSSELLKVAVTVTGTTGTGGAK